MCGLSGAAVAASGSGLPLVFFLNGQPSSTVMTPTSTTYPVGLSVGISATPWASSPSGCSLRVASAAVTDGNAGVTWKIPKALLLPAIDANAFTVEAKVYPEVWRVGYSKWNADVLGSQCNWDSAFKVSKHSVVFACVEGCLHVQTRHTGPLVVTRNILLKIGPPTLYSAAATGLAYCIQTTSLPDPSRAWAADHFHLLLLRCRCWALSPLTRRPAR